MSRVDAPLSPVAIVGMAGLFPGATSLNQYWHNIVEGKDLIREVPDGRWKDRVAGLENQSSLKSIGLAEPDRVQSLRGGFIDEVSFDFGALNLDSDLLARMDPLIRMVLHVGAAAFADAKMQHVAKERVGIALANIALPTEASSSFSRKTFSADQTDSSLSKEDLCARYVTGLPAGILARGLGVSGGCFTLDAACASSLYSIEIAVRELQSGRADAMIAGGVSKPDSLYTQMGFTALQALSSTGKCSPFDSRADGLVVGEGAGIFILKRLEDALQQGDHIYGLVRAVGLANDVGGKLLAPDSEGQLRALRAAYDLAGWDPTDVELIECHGTGTPVGDAVELKSLKTLWADKAWQPGQCTIGSVKSNIGHLLTGAGAAGLCKVLLSLKHETLPPQANFESANPDQEFSKGPFQILKQAQPWPRRNSQQARRAAVSAFGFGGINAHLLIEEWLPQSASHAKANSKVPAISTSCDIAIVGMDAYFGSSKNLREFQEAVFNGRLEVRHQDGNVGCFLDSLPIEVGEFRIPPSELAQMLPQQLLALLVSKRAYQDAAITLQSLSLESENFAPLAPSLARARGLQLRAGVLVGMSLDCNTSNFDLRWSNLDKRSSESERPFPVLNASRTLGALGGVIASRIARELEFGGPSFALSSEESSGLTSVQQAVRYLQSNQVDVMVAAAVDIAGDRRSLQSTRGLQRVTSKSSANVFDSAADGLLPGEGAGAVVLKRLSDAKRDGNRIYAVIKGAASGSGGLIATDFASDSSLQSAEAMGARVIREAFKEAGFGPKTVGYFESCASAEPTVDRLESKIITALFDGDSEDAAQSFSALGSAKSVVGETGAASGLASIIKSSLCLYHQILPPTPSYRIPRADLRSDSGNLHIPISPLPWISDRALGAKRAGVSSMGLDGSYAHVVLEAAEAAEATEATEVNAEHIQPLGARDEALFLVSGSNVDKVLEGIASLRSFVLANSALQIEGMARKYFVLYSAGSADSRTLALIAKDADSLLKKIDSAERKLKQGAQQILEGHDGIFWNLEPLGAQGELAFVYPGSGNHFLGMGVGVALEFPQLLRNLDRETPNLARHFMPQWHSPYRLNWAEGYSQLASQAVAADQNRMIFGQVSFGVLLSDFFKSVGVLPNAAIGYSLGETTSLLSLRAWPDRDEMFHRMTQTTLFVNELAGRCEAARRHFGISDEAPFEWRVALVRKPAEQIRERLRLTKYNCYLLIVNSPEESVVGGEAESVMALIQDLEAHFWNVEGVSTVHCAIVDSVKQAYKDLHLNSTRKPEGIRFYSSHFEKSYEVSKNSAADSIIAHALKGFDFSKVIGCAYQDGVRVFLELGPQASCTRAISKTLASKPFVALSASVKGVPEFSNLLRTLARLAVERIPVDFHSLYGVRSFAQGHQLAKPAGSKSSSVSGPVSRRLDLPVRILGATVKSNEPLSAPQKIQGALTQGVVPNGMLSMAAATAEAHGAFLSLSTRMSQVMEQTLRLQVEFPDAFTQVTRPSAKEIVAFDRQACLEFARGSLGKVLGDTFKEADEFPTRVRLPDEPLMLVDRIVSVSGEAHSLKRGACVTEHDVKAGAWYLEEDRMPVCIAVEAGQADLFLSAYLGIDKHTRGERRYRLLDAKIVFHRELPRPGEVVRYEIEIDRFIKQGSTYMFFFRFDGFVGETPLLTMSEGCAGFFSQGQLEDSQGIVLTTEDQAPQIGKVPEGWSPPVAMKKESFSESQISALRAGKLSQCFGAEFESIELERPVTLPGGRMKLIDRVTELDPKAGRYGLGKIRAEADIHPYDWFLTCHFIDDQVMPGTLMYECCLHTLRVYLLRMGWIAESGTVAYEPVQGIRSQLLCRGQVLASTKVAAYEIEIKEIGFNPHPYVVADALMYADGKRIVRMANMSVQLTGLTQAGIDKLWKKKSIAFNTDRITAFAIGKPSVAFGDKYLPFDSSRKIARLPGPPFQFLDRIVDVSGASAWKLENGSQIIAEYDVPAKAWYFAANRQSSMPYSVLLETALQPCGWLAAYLGSALASPQDLKFRNLGGTAVQREELFADAGTLRTQVKLLSFSEAGGMLIQKFHFLLSRNGRTVFEGDTQFGFFSVEALAQQLGVRGASDRRYEMTTEERARASTLKLPLLAPFTPELAIEQAGESPVDSATISAAISAGNSSANSSLAIPREFARGAAFPAAPFRLIDSVQVLLEGGPHGLGFVKSESPVDEKAWYFKAHFFEDPVVPGSLGLESFLQLLKVYMSKRWPELTSKCRFASVLESPHTWVYRGQVIPRNSKVSVEAHIVHAAMENGGALVRANGFLVVDGITIYEMKNFGLRLL